LKFQEALDTALREYVRGVFSREEAGGSADEYFGATGQRSEYHGDGQNAYGEWTVTYDAAGVPIRVYQFSTDSVWFRGLIAA
jgi:hypothetical protein